MAKIMLVEDDNNLREIYQARLTAEGYETVSAADGEEALALAVKEKPDLIIADIMMPKISGFDMLDILRSTPEIKHTKIIMMTALSQAEDRARANKLGADRYLVKSQVTLEDVVKTAKEVLESNDGPPNQPAADKPSTATTIPMSVAPGPSDSPATTPTPVATPSEPSITTSIPMASPPSDPATITTPTQDITPAPPADTPAAATPAEPTSPLNEAPDPKVLEPSAGTKPAVLSPAHDPSPKPSTDTAASTAVAIDAAGNLSQPATAEEASVEAQIQDFIKQTGTKTSEPNPTPASPAGPAPALGTPPTDAPAASTSAPIITGAKPSDGSVAKVTAFTVGTPSTPAAPGSNNPNAVPAPQLTKSEVPTHSNKIIQPINDLTKQPDLNALVAEEGVTATAAPSADTVIAPDGTTTVASSEPLPAEPEAPPSQDGSAPAPPSTPHPPGHVFLPQTPPVVDDETTPPVDPNSVAL
ncbi:MAG: hypothetical protein JWS12_626 [Candidatus Saccharibacteria bacterium]|nr:hypothetical protein [Candidatus Saccharibacteria bacterium]